MYWTRPMTRDEAVMYARRKAAERYREPIETMWPHHFVVGLRRAGFAIVPVEPTTAMVFAAERHAHGDAMIRAAYAAYEKEMGDG